ncbi:MAG: magnesium/cobalt transporter CorA [Solirubrobacteraceae bacterium]
MSSGGQDQPAAGDEIVVPCLGNEDIDALAAHLRDKRFFWLDLKDPSDAELERIGELLHLHPLTLADAKAFHERPKREEYSEYVYLVVYGVDAEVQSGSHLLREVHLVIAGACVVTIRRGPFAALEELRKRYDGVPLRGEQFVIYKILDAVIGTYVPVLARTDDDIDELEQSVISKPTEGCLQRIFSLKRDLIAMRRVVTPMRDFFARDEQKIADLPGMKPDDRLYLRDLYDSLIRVSDLIDSYRDLLSGATDMYLSTIANRQGEIAKQLTIIATIFLPLSFLTGFFGQNFTFLTGHVLDHTWAFFVLGLGLLAVSVAILWFFFQHKGWLAPD